MNSTSRERQAGSFTSSSGLAENGTPLAVARRAFGRGTAAIIWPPR